jgi:hypothetical protein
MGQGAPLLSTATSGLRQRGSTCLASCVNYEGRAAVELEAACDLGEQRAYELLLLDDGGHS